MSEKLSKVKNIVAGHYFSYKTFFVLLCVLGGSLYITWSVARDRVMELWLMPAYDTVHGVPVIGAAIDWFAAYTATWRWDQIILSAMMLCLGAFVGWFYGKPRTEAVDVSAASAPSAGSITEKTTEDLSTVKETVEETAQTAGKTKAELLEDIERITKAIKELKD